MPLVLGVDSSTQSTKVEVRDADTGALVGEGRAPHPPTTPPRSEQHPDAWWAALESARAGLPAVDAIAVAGQQHGLVALDDRNEVIRPAKLWNDTESAPDAQWLRQQLDDAAWARACGSVPVASFTITKLSWLHRAEPDAWARLARVCLPHDWLTWKLSGAFVTDRGDASGTGYFSASDDAYRTDLLAIVEGDADWVPRLPRVASPTEGVGTSGTAGVPPEPAGRHRDDRRLALGRHAGADRARGVRGGGLRAARRPRCVRCVRRRDRGTAGVDRRRRAFGRVPARTRRPRRSARERARRDRARRDRRVHAGGRRAARSVARVEARRRRRRGTGRRRPRGDPGPVPRRSAVASVVVEYADSILDLVGNTPLVRLKRLSEAEGVPGTLLAKVETVNPGGSVKDRPAIAMIDAAERDGLLQPGGTIVEPTSGNTGAGLAIVAAQRGYRCIFVMSDKMSDEKVALLRAYGAEVVVCPTAVPPEDPRSYYSTAERLVRETPGAFRPDQYSNPANPAAHFATTGPEIWRQTDGRITHFVAGLGTGGTITGVGRYLKARSPTVQIVGADPSGSVYSGGTGRPYLVEGVGEDFWPATFDRSLVDRVVEVSDADSFITARRVTREEGLLIGGSGGTAVHAALVVGRDLG